MDNQLYEEKLRQLTEIFDGDVPFARAVLNRWLQKHRKAIEAGILAEVTQRLAGLSSIIPLSFKIVIDSQGVRLAGKTPASRPETRGKGKPAPKVPAAKRGKETIPLFEA